MEDPSSDQFRALLRVDKPIKLFVTEQGPSQQRQRKRQIRKQMAEDPEIDVLRYIDHCQYMRKHTQRNDAELVIRHREDQKRDEHQATDDLQSCVIRKRVVDKTLCR